MLPRLRLRLPSDAVASEVGDFSKSVLDLPLPGPFALMVGPSSLESPVLGLEEDDSAGGGGGGAGTLKTLSSVVEAPVDWPLEGWGLLPTPEGAYP